MNVESNQDNWTQDYEEFDEVDEDGEGIVEARGRGTSYTSQEDVWLCKTYCAVGMDASVGTDQTRDTYWARMKEHFDSINTYPKKERTDRSDRSLRSRWSLIATECQKWAGVLAATDAMNPSGSNEVDRVSLDYFYMVTLLLAFSCILLSILLTLLFLFVDEHCTKLVQGTWQEEQEGRN